MEHTKYCFIQNQKQLFGSTQNMVIEEFEYKQVLDHLQNLKNNTSEKQHSALCQFETDFHNLINSSFIITAQKTGYKTDNNYCITLPPNGWSNSINKINLSPEALLKQWECLEKILTAIDSIKKHFKLKTQEDLPLIKLSGISRFIAIIDSHVPKNFKLDKANKYLITPFSPLDYHRSNNAFAIFMAGTEKGFMNDNKKPTAIGSVRLFESKAAAERTAKAALFGSPSGGRGPALIVQLEVTAQNVAFTIDSKPATGSILEHFALLEAKEIENAIEDASFNSLLQRLQIMDPSAHENIIKSLPCAHNENISNDNELFKTSPHSSTNAITTAAKLPPTIEAQYSYLTQACTQNLGGFAIWQYIPEKNYFTSDEQMGYLDKHDSKGRISGASFELNEKTAQRKVQSYSWGLAQSAAVYARLRPCAIVGMLGDVPEFNVLQTWVDECSALHQLKLMEKSKTIDLVKAIEKQLQSIQQQDKPVQKARRI